MASIHWGRVKIRQYLDWLDINSDETIQGIDKHIALLSALTDKPRDYYESLPLGKLKKLAAKSAVTTISKKFPKYFWLKGKLYRVANDITKVKAGQLIDLMEFRGDIHDMHKFLAVVCLPVNIFGKSKYDGATHGERASLFYNHLTIDIAYPISLFFSQVWEACLRDIADYSNKMTETQTEIMRAILEKAKQK